VPPPIDAIVDPHNTQAPAPPVMPISPQARARPSSPTPTKPSVQIEASPSSAASQNGKDQRKKAETQG
jgi:hypothetical protein